MKLKKHAALVIVGVTGDLSKRKLIPALYHLEKEGLINKLRIIGTSRRDVDAAKFAQEIKEILKKENKHLDNKSLEKLIKRISFLKVDSSDKKSMSQLEAELITIEEKGTGCLNRLFYLAVPPNVFEKVVTNIGELKLDDCSHGKQGKLLIEKPFGDRYKTAVKLDSLLKKYFKEEQIYRIDHYLAKETAQNIFYFRFKNPLVHDLFSSKFIDHVQITIAEQIDIEGRAGFYEQTGALKDIIQSHAMQLLALTTVKRPEMDTAEHARRAREKALAKVLPVNPKTDVVRGQYEGYRKEVKNQKSNVETYVALKFNIDSPDWRDTPIYIRTGKGMKRKNTEITIVYKDEKIADCPDNLLTFKIQPDEGISLLLQAKKPGLSSSGQDIVMDYEYKRAGHEIKYDAYEKLLIDAMNSDQTLFPSSKEIEASWKALDPVVKYWAKNDLQPDLYDKGSWGPDSAKKLLEKDNREWLAFDN